jgi:cell division protein FtsQ
LKRKYNIKRVSFLGLLFLITVLAIAVVIQQKKQALMSVEVVLHPEKGMFFLDEQQVLKLLQKPDGSLWYTMGMEVGEMRTFEMVKQLRKSPYIQDASIHMGYGGKMRVVVYQREPLFRVINQQGISYYVEKSGIKMPYMPFFPVRVPVLTGFIAEGPADSTHVSSDLLRQSLLLFEELSTDDLLSAQIEQVYVDKNKGFILIPKVGNHTIVVGNSDRLQEKFTYLKVFYLQGLNQIGWDKYTEIDLRFKGQVVGR